MIRWSSYDICWVGGGVYGVLGRNPKISRVIHLSATVIYAKLGLEVIQGFGKVIEGKQSSVAEGYGVYPVNAAPVAQRGDHLIEGLFVCLFVCLLVWRRDVRSKESSDRLRYSERPVTQRCVGYGRTRLCTRVCVCVLCLHVRICLHVHTCLHVRPIAWEWLVGLWCWGGRQVNKVEPRRKLTHAHTK
jgi:hypothetical protein